MFHINITEDEMYALINEYAQTKKPDIVLHQKSTAEREKEIRKSIEKTHENAQEYTKIIQGKIDELKKQINELEEQRNALIKPAIDTIEVQKRELDALWNPRWIRGVRPRTYDQAVIDWQCEVKTKIKTALKLNDHTFDSLWEFAQENTSYDCYSNGDPIEGSHFHATVEFIFELLRIINTMQPTDEGE